MTQREERPLAAEYVLGLLEGDEHAQAERRLGTDPAFAREVEQWRERFAAFDDSAMPVAAGEGLWRRIEAALPGTSSAAAERHPFWGRWWNSVPALRATAAGAALAALVLAVGLGFAIREAQRQPQYIAVLLDGDRAGAVVHAFADGRVVLVPLADIPVPQGRALEVWTLPSKERGPVSVGLMDRPRTLPLRLTDLPRPGPDQLFEITLEPATGSPTGRPTGPVLFLGRTSSTL